MSHHPLTSKSQHSSIANIPNLLSLRLIFLILIINKTTFQQLVILHPSSTQILDGDQTIYNSSDTNSTINTDFTYDPYKNSKFNCSMDVMWAYQVNPKSNAYDKYHRYVGVNKPYTISISGITNNATLDITIQTVNKQILPYIFQTNNTTYTCQQQQHCQFNIMNNCNNQSSFDIILLNISHLQNSHSNITSFGYYVLCNNIKATAEYGMVILIVYCTIATAITAFYSQAPSIGGFGVPLTIPLTLSLAAALLGGGFIAFYQQNVSSVLVDVFSWIFIIPSFWLCSNQLLFYVVQWKTIKNPIFEIKKIKVTVRIIDIISLIISIGFSVGWWISKDNWILIDFLATSIFVACVKIFKFQSLKQAIVAFFAAILIQIVFIVVIDQFLFSSYKAIVLNKYSSPFLFQVPTIKPVYNVRCAWISVTSIVFPCALLSLLRRFDKSKSTKYVYLITSIIVFSIGSIILITITLTTANATIPFGLIPEPIMICFIFYWSRKRKQTGILWSGKFYDQEFADHQSYTNQLNRGMSTDKSSVIGKVDNDLFQGLQIPSDHPHMRDTIVDQINIQDEINNQKQTKNKNNNGIQLMNIPLSQRLSYVPQDTSFPQKITKGSQ